MSTPDPVRPGALAGTVVYLTGGGSGLGRGLIDRFVAEGARVGVLEWSTDKVKQLTDDFDRDAVVAVQGDVSNLGDQKRAVAETVAAFGRLDTAVQCAAIAEYTPFFTALPEDSIDQAFDDIMRINVKGQIYTALAATPELRKTGGNIILTLSTAAYGPSQGHTLYMVSKHAGVGVVEQLAWELAPEVRVNAVCPGGIFGSQLAGAAALGQDQLTPAKLVGGDEGLQKMMEEHSPTGLYATPADYGGIYTLLATKTEARNATGSIIFWDAGVHLVGAGRRPAIPVT